MLKTRFTITTILTCTVAIANENNRYEYVNKTVKEEPLLHKRSAVKLATNVVVIMFYVSYYSFKQVVFTGDYHVKCFGMSTNASPLKT